MIHNSTAFAVTALEQQMFYSAGERIQHHNWCGDSSNGQPAWRERVTALLRAAAAGGRVHKQYGG